MVCGPLDEAGTVNAPEKTHPSSLADSSSASTSTSSKGKSGLGRKASLDPLPSFIRKVPTTGLTADGALRMRAMGGFARTFGLSLTGSSFSCGTLSRRHGPRLKASRKTTFT
eukprot:scaffold57_cov254-Pinguiococcus_pyrenoidosus.AAC.46